MNSNKCNICGNSEFDRYLYNNHNNKIGYLLKAFIGLLFFHIFKVINLPYYQRFIFAQLMFIKYCKKCNHGILINNIKNDELQSYYSQNFWDTVGVEMPNESIRAQGQFKYVNNYLQKYNLRVLEIGAGSAAMLILLKKNNENIILDVVEPGEQWSNHYQKYNINKVASFFPWKSVLSYDYIHTSHWLEHVLDLDSVIISIKDIMNKNGYIYIEVPNANTEYWDVDIKDVPHINFFSIKSLQILMSKHGFMPVKIGEYGYTNVEFFESVVNGKKISKLIVDDAEKSISNSLERKDGNIIRSLFKLI